MEGRWGIPPSIVASSICLLMGHVCGILCYYVITSHLDLHFCTCRHLLPTFFMCVKAPEG